MGDRITNNDSDEEMDLLDLLKTIYKGKKTIIRFIIVFGVFGLFTAIFSEKEYTASTTVVPQSEGTKVGSDLGGLAAIAGINLDKGGAGTIPPSLYPEIVQSVPFKRALLNVPLEFSHIENRVTYREYYKEHKKSNVFSFVKSYTIGLPSKMISLFKGKSNNITGVGVDSIYRVSFEDNKLFKQIGKQLRIENNKKDGFIKISFSMPEALPSAQMTKKLQELLQEAITNFKIQKTKDEFKFIEERYNELKKDFKKKQATLARFRDRNQGLVTSRSQSQIESLKSEYNLAYNIYSELAKQLERQKIKLKENTPIFTIIEPVSVPVTKSNPRGVLILLVFLFLGGALGIGFLFGKEWLEKLKIKNQ